jgi:hypothetical protein
LGSFHATGKEFDPVATIVNSLRNICSRCSGKTERLILGALCPSCDARDREAKRFRNSKGTVPKLSSVLHDEHIAVAEGGVIRVLNRSFVTGLPEVMIQAARSATTPLVFGRRQMVWTNAMVRSSSHRPWATQFEIVGLAGGLATWQRRNAPRRPKLQAVSMTGDLFA